jgi:hypothetical protein
MHFVGKVPDADVRIWIIVLGRLDIRVDDVDNWPRQ